MINIEYLINKFLDNKINYIEILKNNNIVKSFTIKEIGGFYEAVENILHSDLLFLFDDIKDFYKLNEKLKEWLFAFADNNKKLYFTLMDEYALESPLLHNTYMISSCYNKDKVLKLLLEDHKKYTKEVMKKIIKRLHKNFLFLKRLSSKRKPVINLLDIYLKSKLEVIKK